MRSTLNFLNALTLPLLALPQPILQPLRLEIRPQLDKNQIEPARRFRQRWFPVTADGIRAAATYALKDLARAQEDFAAKRHLGKLVVIPPP
jgi:hypothetical protein